MKRFVAIRTMWTRGELGEDCGGCEDVIVAAAAVERSSGS
jgi:hypothetical protein